MGLWERSLSLLTAPSASIREPVQQGTARLLASCLLFMTLCFASLDAYLLSTIDGYTPPWGGYALLVVSYGLSRTKLYRLGAVTTTLMFMLVPVGFVLTEPLGSTTSLVFCAAAPVLAGIFLGFRGVVAVAMLNGLLVASVSVLARDRYSFDDVVLPMCATIVIGAVAALYTAHRDWVEVQRHRAGELQDAQFQQMQKMEAIGRLAGGIAHDFNNLLTVISGGVELLQRKGSSKEVDLIDSATRSARDLTSQLLMLSRQGLVEHGSADIAEVMRDLKELLVRIIGEDIEVVVDVKPDTPRVALSASRLQQVLLNLATNARDAMPRGGILKFSAAPERGGVELLITDTGKGMDEAIRRRVFEPFFTTKEVGKGTGLGLAMVFGIVSQAVGTVELTSVRHEGTKVRIWLPCADDLARPALSERRIPISAASNACILLVEDADGVRSLCERVLSEAGYDVMTAASPPEAMDLFERHYKRIDLIVSDLVMPVLNGTEMVSAFRRRVPELPVLYMSGYAPEDVAVEPVDARLLLQKPFRPADLLRAVSAVLKGDPT